MEIGTQIKTNTEKRWLEIEFSFTVEDVVDRQGQRCMYPFVWLRDNCQCSECFQSDATARLQLFRDLDLNDSPVNTQVSDDGTQVTITWTSGHVSSFASNWLFQRRFPDDVTPENRLEYEEVLWGSHLQDNVKRDSYNNLLTCDEALHAWLVELERTGIFVVTEAPPRENALFDIANRVSHLKNTNYGVTFRVETKANPSNLAYTAKPLGLHTDMPYYSYVPGVQMLHCIAQSSQGGSNEFSDGFQAAEQLRQKDPEAFRILCKTEVDFIDVGTDAVKFHLFQRKPVIRLDNRGRVDQISYNNAVRDSHLNLSPQDVEPFYKALRKFDNLLYCEENLIKITLNSGDIICFHNYRVLHGRQGYCVDGGQQRLLVGGYIDWDELHSKRRVLEPQMRE